jgi:hypothetical protein
MTDTPSSVEAEVAYLAHFDGPAQHLIYPPSSGRQLVRPKQEYHRVRITDARTIRPRPTLDTAGFELRRHRSGVRDFYDDDLLRERYYAEVIELMKGATGAIDVIVFDHNQRSAVRAAAGQYGVRSPVDAAHNDYTPSSGPRRAAEILEEAGKPALAAHRRALINVWRPIVGPVQDVPLAVCDARSAEQGDLVETEIHHFGEDDLEHPRHTGRIYSLRHNPRHRWYYVASMQPDEVLLLKNWDSADDGRACYTPHTGFKNPAAPADAVPRESIEIRTLVVYA